MTTITADRDAIIEEIEIAAPPERVFAAISDPPRLLAYTWEATWLGHPTSVVRWALTANSRRNARKGHAQRPARASGGDR
jgi:uncharacterized protein YndB with AHSA1/START domain